MNKIEMIEKFQNLKDNVSDTISDLEDMKNELTSMISELEVEIEQKKIKGATLDQDDFSTKKYYKDGLKSSDDKKIPKDDLTERAFYRGYNG